MHANKTVLFTLRTYKHLPYVYRLINLIASSFRCVIHVDDRWDSDSLQRVRESSLLSTGIEIIPAIKLSVFQRTLCEFKEYYTYLYYEHRFGGGDFYTKRWRGYQKLFKPLNFMARIPYARRVLLSNRVRSFLSRLYKSELLSAYMKNANVGAVVCTSLNLRFSNEDFYLQTAKSCGIKSYYPVLTWDNLSTKGSFISTPGTAFCFNSLQRRQLKKWHRITSSVHISGSLFFEKWMSLREAVVKSDRSNDKPYILYLGSSSNIIGDERHIINLLRLVLYKIKEKLNIDVGLLVKNHPAKINKVDSSLGIDVYEDFGLCESHDHEIKYAQLLYNSAAVFGVNTSGLIDATFVNDNVFALTDAGKSRQSGVLHFEEMCKSFHIKKMSLSDVDSLKRILVAALSKEVAHKGVVQDHVDMSPSQFMKECICAEMD